MSEKEKDQLPIGYWLKRADELLTSSIDEAQRSNNLTRLEWQAINVIQKTGAASRQDVVQTLRAFANASAVDDVLYALVERAVVTVSDSKEYTLTNAGRDLYGRALSAQKEIRLRAAIGITEDEYNTTVSVLRRLVENLASDSAA